jgi:hypothetical protein
MLGGLIVVDGLAHVALVAGTSVACIACNRDHSSGRGEVAVTAPQGTDCGHTACGSNFFIDVAPPGDCAPGANCSVAISLVATGDFHINDEYPYKFTADDAPGMKFLGTDAMGPKVFSKSASNWQKTAAQKGIMSVVFQAADKGSKTVAGTFKLSVCSQQNCQLEQQSVSTAVSVH